MAFDTRVVPSVTTSQLTTRPTLSNSPCNSESVVFALRRWTCMVIDTVIPFDQIVCNQPRDPWQLAETRSSCRKSSYYVYPVLETNESLVAW